MILPPEIIVTEAKVGTFESAPFFYEKRYKGVMNGDILICLRGENNEARYFTEGEEYVIIRFNDIHYFNGFDTVYRRTIYLRDNNGEVTDFEIGSPTSDRFCLKHIFLKHIRRQKLEQLRNSLIKKYGDT